MAYAIATETMEFNEGRHSSGKRDIAAHTALLAGCNLRLLGRIRQAPSREYCVFLAEGMRQARTYRRVAWSHLAETPSLKSWRNWPICCCAWNGLTRAFCTAGMGDRLLISIRSETGADCAGTCGR